MKTSISLSELAVYLKTDSVSLKNFIIECGLKELLSKNRLHFDRMPLILDVYKKKYNIRNGSWPLPGWLSSNRSRWAQTLIGMYREDVAFPASLPPSQGETVYNLILENRPRNVIEIGCFIGVSSIWIGQALKTMGRGHLFSIDLFDRKLPLLPWHCGFLDNPLKFAEDHVKKANLNKFVDFVQMQSSVFGNNIIRFTDREIDFLFIDGDHSISGCVDDFITYYPHVRAGGKILLHDIYPEHCGCLGPRYLIDNINKHKSLFEIHEIETEPNFGMAMVTKLKDSKIFYPWNNPKIEIIRQFNRAKKSTFFQNFVKPKLKRRFN